MHLCAAFLFMLRRLILTDLVSAGYKVAICEQMEDPKQAKGIVKREVIKVVTPGTNINTLGLDETRNNYLMSIVYLGDILELQLQIIQQVTSL